MTIPDVLAAYPHINFRYVKTHIPIMDDMPDGYRWADPVECEYWWHIEGAVQVRRGDEWTDIAIPADLSDIDLGAYHS